MLFFKEYVHILTHSVLAYAYAGASVVFVYTSDGPSSLSVCITSKRVEWFSWDSDGV